MKVRELTLAAVISGLYATLVIILLPISYGPIQLRIADCLIPLAALLGMPAVVGVSLGAFIANMYYFISPIDVVFGAFANLVAGFFILKLRSRLFFACTVASIIIGVIVGGYLWLFFPPPEIFGLAMPLWLAMIVSITLSSLLAIAVLGYSLVKMLKASGIEKVLKSRGYQPTE